MSSHFKWYPGDESLTVPWNAQYTFPSQSNKAEKLTPRIPPKTGGSFTQGNTIRLEFPAQGYVNPVNTTLSFDVTLYPSKGTTAQIVRFQNNIQSCFSRVRLLYGSTPIEDIVDYNQLVRSLTEWTSTSNQTMDQTSIKEGIGGIVVGPSAYTTIADGTTDETLTAVKYGLCNVRQKYIQGCTKDWSSTNAFYNGNFDTSFFLSAGSNDTPQGLTPNDAWPTVKPVTRRYQVQLALGMLMQQKLIPTKWMASQLSIEITLERNEGCIYVVGNENLLPGLTPVGDAATSISYGISNVTLIPEILQFDSSYDTMFLQGLKTKGVPIKFSSWHSTTATIGSNNVNINIQERSRSVKAIFALQKRPQQNFNVDNGATFFDTASNGLSSLQTFQFRLGGRYYPASPVQCSTTLGSAFSNGGAEAYVELEKALNILGDYRLSTGCNITRWALQAGNYQFRDGTVIKNRDGLLSEYDYSFDATGINPADGRPYLVRVEAADDGVVGTGSTARGTVNNQFKHNSFCGSLGSACFGMAINLETSNGLEVSGLNGEEQSDFNLIAQWKGTQLCGSISPGPPNLLIFTYFDAMLILRENNVIELIQ